MSETTPKKKLPAPPMIFRLILRNGEVFTRGEPWPTLKGSPGSTVVDTKVTGIFRFDAEEEVRNEEGIVQPAKDAYFQVSGSIAIPIVCDASDKEALRQGQIDGKPVLLRPGHPDFEKAPVVLDGGRACKLGYFGSSSMGSVTEIWEEDVERAEYFQPATDVHAMERYEEIDLLRTAVESQEDEDPPAATNPVKPPVVVPSMNP